MQNDYYFVLEGPNRKEDGDLSNLAGFINEKVLRSFGSDTYYLSIYKREEGRLNSITRFELECLEGGSLHIVNHHTLNNEIDELMSKFLLGEEIDQPIDLGGRIDKEVIDFIEELYPIVGINRIDVSGVGHPEVSIKLDAVRFGIYYRNKVLYLSLSNSWFNFELALKSKTDKYLADWDSFKDELEEFIHTDPSTTLESDYIHVSINVIDGKLSVCTPHTSVVLELPLDREIIINELIKTIA